MVRGHRFRSSVPQHGGPVSEAHWPAFKRHRDSFFGTASLKPPGQRGILAAKVGSEGFWDGDSDYGGGVRVGRHFGARWLVP